jgi:N-methylhydantoinase A
MLQIGPESAGSDPGPVCYGQGNDRPTVTDANLVLGRINAERPIGGKLDRLDGAAAERAIAKHIGEPLGLDAMAAAEAVIRVANSRMAGAIRLVSIERGHDPAKFAVMPFGGGGALHVGALIQDVGLARAIVPRFPGINSALGCVIADIRHDKVQTLNTLLDDLDVDDTERRMIDAAEAGRALIEASGVALSDIDCVFDLDMCYQGQTHTVDVTLPVSLADTALGLTRQLIADAFVARYRRVFGRPLEGLPMRVLNFRVAVIGRRPKFDLELLAPDAEGSAAPVATRSVWCEGGWRETPIYDRLALPVDTSVSGPAILEQPDTTIFLEPGLTARVDRFGNLIIEPV